MTILMTFFWYLTSNTQHQLSLKKNLAKRFSSKWSAWIETTGQEPWFPNRIQPEVITYLLRVPNECSFSRRVRQTLRDYPTIFPIALLCYRKHYCILPLHYPELYNFINRITPIPLHEPSDITNFPLVLSLQVEVLLVMLSA